MSKKEPLDKAENTDDEFGLDQFGLEYDEIEGVSPKWATSTPILAINAICFLLMMLGMIFVSRSLLSDFEITKPIVDWYDARVPNWFKILSIYGLMIGSLWGAIFFTCMAISTWWLKRTFRNVDIKK